MTLKECYRCKLANTRNNVVVGRGNMSSPFVLIGEAPGDKEDLSGVPFCGESGQLLNDWLAYVGLQDYYITNIVKCRPPKNRKPHKDEIKSCTPWLLKQIKTQQPRVIVPIGTIAASFIMGSEYSTGILKYGGHLYLPNNKEVQDENIYRLYKTKLLIYPLIHPSYFLRNRNKSWSEQLQTLVLLVQLLGGKSEKDTVTDSDPIFEESDCFKL